jgi:hypothetical protein
MDQVDRKSECEGSDGDDRFCPKCRTQLSLEDCEKHKPPRGMPSCLWLCTCPVCGHQCCCEKEAPEPRFTPPINAGLTGP